MHVQVTDVQPNSFTATLVRPEEVAEAEGEVLADASMTLTFADGSAPPFVVGQEIRLVTFNEVFHS
jgi:hypothetical protein